MLFLVFLVYANFALIKTFFMATLTFNIAISTMFLIGLLILYQSAIRLTMLAGTFGILAYKTGKSLEFYLEGITKILPPTIAHMLNRRAKKGVLFFTSQETKEVTEWLDGQFFQQKGYINFFVGTSLLLGLFGTFTGLLVAIDEMGAIILSFGGDNIDIAEVMTGFSGPLGGMAIGFASSLFGVSSAIILNVMQYMLSRNQASFIHDVEEWMKAKIIDTQTAEVKEQLQQSKEISTIISSQAAGSPSGGSSLSAGFLDAFVETMGDFTEKMERSNSIVENMFGKISEKLEHNLNKTDNESILLKNMLETLKESNVNQYSNAKMMEETLQEIATVMLAEHKTLKRNLEIQEQNNKLLLELLQTIKKR